MQFLSEKQEKASIFLYRHSCSLALVISRDYVIM